MFKLEDEKPIYIQIANWMEDAILSGAFQEEAQVPSTTELSATYRINPATALKGVNLLVEEGILYKKRGLGMFVRTGAVEKVAAKHKQQFYEGYVDALIREARKLHLKKQDILDMIERGFEQP
jgi:GntR family transcriptional regulator